MTAGRRLRTAALGGGVVRAALAAALDSPYARSARWQRQNYRGATVSLLAGPTVAVAATLSAAAGCRDPRLRRAALVAGLGAGLFGAYDDLAGAAAVQRADKGFRGHLRALAQGRVSAGLVKLAGVGAAGLVAAGGVSRTPAQRLVAGGVVAGSANLVNLLDLRPGRAVKAVAAVAVPLSATRGPGGDLVGGPLGAAAGVLPDDLAERVMLGDAGANALGALVGLALAAGTRPRGRAALLAGIVALTAASERVSFTAVIESTPPLRALDRLGRRP